MEKFNVKNLDRILIIAPHPDDECIGVGGLLLKYAKQCDVWILTDGAAGKQDVSIDYIVNRRKSEFIAEMELLNIHNYRMFNIADGTLQNNLECLCKENLSCYTKIFVTNKNDIHLDHRAAYKAVKKALLFQKLNHIELYQYEITEPISYASHMLDISDVIDLKMDLISLHGSQMALFDYCCIAKSINSYRAATMQMRNSYVEVYLLSDILNEADDEYINLLQADIQKLRVMNRVYDMWIQAKSKEIGIVDYVDKHNYCSIAVYGLGILGRRLIQELKESHIKITCVIDRKAQMINDFDINVIKPNKNIPIVDVIIVTAVYDYDNIKKQLKQYGYNNIISLETIVNEINDKSYQCLDKKPLVYLWGMGQNFECVLQSIDENYCEIGGIIDCNKEKIGKVTNQKYKIYFPDDILIKEYDYIIISTMHSNAIVKQLQDLNCDFKKVINFWSREEDVSKFKFINLLKRENYFLRADLENYKIRLNNLPYEVNAKPVPIVCSAIELLDKIILEKSSLCRYGDGEFELMRQKKRGWFQRINSVLAKRLKEIFYSKNNNIIIAIADNFGNLDKYTDCAADTIRKYLNKETRTDLMKLIGTQRKYYDAYVSRPYIIYKDKSQAVIIFNKFKKIFYNRNIVIVEGRYTRNGVGNDLFLNAQSIRRIICPEKDCFDKYNQILDKIKINVNKDDLIVISLGQTATVLAYDLAMEGYQSLDIGQIDNEYEWYLRGVDERVEIPGKTVSELSWCHIPQNIIHEEYNKQIICNLCDNN